MLTHLRDDRPYLSGVIAIAIAWLVGMCASVVLTQAGWLAGSGDLLLTVGVGSGVVALIAGLPGVATEWLPGAERAPARITIGFSAGVVIRLLGTVALLGLCSYHLPAAKNEIAGTILAWYIFLTTVDVIVLAMLLPRQDRPAVTRS